MKETSLRNPHSLRRLRRAAIFLLSLAALLPLPAAAQLYKVDAIFDDSVQVYAAKEDGASAGVGAPAFKVADGDTLLVEAKMDEKSQYALFTRDGSRYVVHAKYLVFCSDNAEETTDLFPLSTASRLHTPLARFFAHPAPVAAVGGLLLLALLLCFAGKCVHPLRKGALAAVPLCLLAATALALLAYHALGADALWWCDAARCGFAPSLLRMLPFAAAVLFLFYSFRVYRAALFAGRAEKASLRPMALSMGACVPVLLVFVAAGWAAGLSGDTLEYSAVAVFILTLLAGTVYSTLRNMRRYGAATGVALTVFAGVYVAACATAVGAALLALLSMPLQTLVFALVIAFVVVAVRAARHSVHKSSQPAAASQDEAGETPSVAAGVDSESVSDSLPAAPADGQDKTADGDGAAKAE